MESLCGQFWANVDPMYKSSLVCCIFSPIVLEIKLAYSLLVAMKAIPGWCRE